ncbi:hypothetical protein GDO86_013204 [Hymenochirus boettgeri]|uniref:DUF3719 domain-containing protein n=1 Tax=Hymenochirus boettgeri TaxID=247094 RepID=A0A8T2IUC1_9PIPI|nr:hypothetical protein GDO86_013204 [Hymenochirus boettgeri]
MISRYKRKPVSQVLQINQNITENHPLPEKVDAQSNPPCGDQYRTNLHSKSELDISETLSTSRKNKSESWSASQSYTGLLTDNSSEVSWGFDEFDQAATRQVQKIFSQIDEWLFEHKVNTLASGLQEECQQWSSCFPHLRVKGKQIASPLDDGYSWHSGCPNEETDALTLSTANTSELGVYGIKCPFSILSDPNAQVSFSLGANKEEGEDEFGVIASDGIIEEYLAFDSKEKEDELCEWTRVMSLDSLKMGYPPVSPKYCKKEAVIACLFDDVWREVVGCLEDLICHHWEESISDDDKQDIVIKTTREEPLNPYAPHRLPLVLPPVPHYKIPSVSPGLSTKRNRTSKTKKRGRQTHGNRPQGTSMSSRNLNDLMVIHGILLQQRNLLVEKMLDSDEKLSARPTSAALISAKQRAGCPLEHSCSSLSHNVPSARRRNPPRTLHPINNNLSRAGTPKIEELIKGKRLPNASDQLSCSPVPFTRNNLLPPIGVWDPDHHNTAESQRQTPDTSLGRSLTAYDPINPLQSRRGSAGTDSITIGVTGTNLGITSSSTSSIRWGQSTSRTDEDHASGIPLHLPLKHHSHGGHITQTKN